MLVLVLLNAELSALKVLKSSSICRFFVSLLGGRWGLVGVGASAYSTKSSPRESYTQLGVIRQCTEADIHGAKQLLSCRKGAHTVEQVASVIVVFLASRASRLNDQSLRVLGDPM